MKRKRHRRVNRHLTLINIGGNICGAALTSLYFALLSMNLEALSGWAWGLLGLVPPLLMISGGILRERFLRPLNSWYLRATDRKETPPAPQSIQQLALNRPAISAGITLVVWLVGGFFAGILIGVVAGAEAFNWAAFLQTSMGSAIVGPITAVLIYFAIERAWRSELCLFFGEKGPSQTPAFRLTVKRRLLILFGMSTMPLLFLAITTYSRAVHMVEVPRPETLLPGLLRLELFMIGVGLFVAVVLARTVGASLVESLETLSQHMDAVRKGNLDRHMTVTSNDELGMLAEGFNAMVDGLRREEVIRRLFGLYVTPQVADYAIQHGAERGGQLIEATVVFADIRSFTSLTERMEPAALIDLLNRYFQAMSAVVVERGGLVNKFGGDSLLAVFGTPLNPAQDHARRAVQAARDLVLALQTFNEDQVRRGEPPLKIGVGVATGPVIAGNVGGEDRLEYTVIGDSVNLASRLETMTKEVEATILLNETAALRVRDRIVLRPMGNVHVRGKQEPQTIYALAGAGGQPSCGRR